MRLYIFLHKLIILKRDRRTFMTKDTGEYFQKNLNMYQHLKNIRDNLWANDGKSRVSVMVGAGFSLNAKKKSIKV